MAGGGGGGGPSFEATPSWIIGTVVLFIVSLSLLAEKLLHCLGGKLKQKEKKPLYEALLKIKEELMLMGFISLLLAVFPDEIGKLCIPEKWTKKWRPCDPEKYNTDDLNKQGRRRLLAVGDTTSTCPEGKIQFASLGVIHNLHIFIFILAVVHVITCTLIVLLGEVKIRKWRKWEESIRSTHIQVDQQRNRPAVLDVHNLTFFKERYEGVHANKRNYVKSFFKHLIGLLTRADYEAMRTGFILTHCNGNQRFNFHKYMVYAFETDFAKVVSISWILWLLGVVFMTFDVVGSNIYLWTSITALVLLLLIGTSLEQVITELAIYVAQRHTVIIGEVKIQPSDEYFFLNRPSIILFLLHVVMFLNSFGLANFFSTWFQFGFKSCLMGELRFVIARLIVMGLIQWISSYSTLPLYAIVTQMGSSYNKEAMEKAGYVSAASIITQQQQQQQQGDRDNNIVIVSEGNNNNPTATSIEITSQQSFRRKHNTATTPTTPTPTPTPTPIDHDMHT